MDGQEGENQALWERMKMQLHRRRRGTVAGLAADLGVPPAHIRVELNRHKDLFRRRPDDLRQIVLVGSNAINPAPRPPPKQRAGRRWTDEQKEAGRRHWTAEQRELASRRWTPAQRKAASQRLKAYWTPERRAAQSEHWKKHYWTPERRAAAARRWAEKWATLPAEIRAAIMERHAQREPDCDRHPDCIARRLQEAS